MRFLYDDAPIVACATGTTTNTAIGVIRLGGFKKIEDLASFFSLPLTGIVPRKSYLTKILAEGAAIDEGLLTYFPAPKSYNGENILELSVHGNQLNIQNIINLFIDSGVFRYAKEGEFTYRALRNKKLNLSQIEGLDLFLNAASNFALKQGLSVLHGELHQSYLELRELFLKLKAAVELGIDFADDVGDAESRAQLELRFADFHLKLHSLYKRSTGKLAFFLAPTVVLIGQANAGKSSLFNAMLMERRAIVSQTAGTTRDYISEFLYLNKTTSFRLIDTAGIRSTTDSIESLGVAKAIELATSAFFKILVVNPLQTSSIDLEKMRDIDFDFLVFTHADLPHFTNARDKILGTLPPVKQSCEIDLSDGPIGPKFSTGPIGPPLQAYPGPIGPGVKNKTGPIGPNGLESIFSAIIEKHEEILKENPITIERQRETIKSIYIKTLEFQRLKNETGDLALLSQELQIVESSLNELIGLISPDDVLNVLFSNFCIGK